MCRIMNFLCPLIKDIFMMAKARMRYHRSTSGDKSPQFLLPHISHIFGAFSSLLVEQIFCTTSGLSLIYFSFISSIWLKPPWMGLSWNESGSNEFSVSPGHNGRNSFRLETIFMARKISIFIVFRFWWRDYIWSTVTGNAPTAR